MRYCPDLRNRNLCWFCSAWSSISTDFSQSVPKLLRHCSIMVCRRSAGGIIASFALRSQSIPKFFRHSSIIFCSAELCANSVALGAAAARLVWRAPSTAPGHWGGVDAAAPEVKTRHASAMQAGINRRRIGSSMVLMIVPSKKAGMHGDFAIIQSSIQSSAGSPKPKTHRQYNAQRPADESWPPPLSNHSPCPI